MTDGNEPRYRDAVGPERLIRSQGTRGEKGTPGLDPGEEIDVRPSFGSFPKATFRLLLKLFLAKRSSFQKTENPGRLWSSVSRI